MNFRRRPARVPRYLLRLLLMLVAVTVALPAAAYKMEAGNFRIAATSGSSPTSTSVAFQQSYDVPPVVFIVATQQGGDATAVRINNVTTAGFRAVMVETPGEDGPHTNMDVDYFAIEPGIHSLTVDAGQPSERTVQIEAGRLNTTAVVCNPVFVACANTFDNHAFSAVYATQPVVLAQLQTTANEQATVPPQPSRPFLTVAVDNVSAAGFDFALDRHEVDDGTITNAAAEDIGFVAIDGNVVAGEFLANNAAMVSVEMETIYVPETDPGAPVGWGNNPFCRRTISFSKSYPSRLIMATKSTRLEADGGWLRRCNRSANGVNFVVDEDVDPQADAERNHVAEAASVVVFSRGYFYDSNFMPAVGNRNFRIEADRVELPPAAWTTVALRQSYAAPPAVFLIVAHDDADRPNAPFNPDPVAIRVRNVTTTSFEAIAVEPNQAIDNPDVTIRAHYLAVEQGVWEFPDGTLLEVGSIATTAQQASGVAGVSDSYQTVNLAAPFSSLPAVLTQVTGVANPPGTPNPVSPWMTVAFEDNTQTPSSFEVALERSEVNDGGVVTAPETITYMAVETGTIADFVDNGGTVISAEVQRTQLNGGANAGWDNICLNPAVSGIPFLNTYSGPPLVVASENAHNGGDGGWQRICNTTATHVRLVEDEDQNRNSERSHTAELGGLMAYSEPFDADFSFIAWYEMEQPSWTSGAVGQVDNTLGAVFDGTAGGGATTALVLPARVNGALSTCRYGTFDGVAGEVVVGPVDFGFEDALTVMTWVRWDIDPRLGNPRAALVQNNSAMNQNQGQFWLRHAINNNLRLEFEVNTTAGSTSARTGFVTAGFLQDQWHHVAGVYDGAEIRIYIDGVLAGSQAHSGDVVAFDTAYVTKLARSAHPGGSFRAFTGDLDEVRIYRRALEDAEIVRIIDYTRPCAQFDHYAIAHVGSSGGFGVTCENEDVTVIAHDGIAPHGETLPPAAGTVVTIQTVPPVDGLALTGLAPGLFSDLGGGSASYQFSGSETRFTVAVTMTTPATVNFNLVDDSLRSEDPTEDPQLTFRDAILELETTGTQISAKPSDAAPVLDGAGTYRLRAIETAAGSGACQAALSGPQTIEMAFRCLAPATCPDAGAGALRDVGAAGFTAPVAVNDLATTPPAYSNVDLVFDAAGESRFVLRYAEAGQVAVLARKQVPNGDLLEGAGNPWTARPFALRIAVTPPGPYASDASGPVIGVAGEDFTVAVQAVAWQAGDDLAAPLGIADGHTDSDPSNNANLADNSPLLGYQAPADVTLAAELVAPSPGHLPGGGALGTIAPFGGGAGSTANANFDEVGVIEIKAVQTGDYLGIGVAQTGAIRGASGYVGRFKPARFDVAAATPVEFSNGLAPDGLPWSCALTYLGQPFAYALDPAWRITARTAQGSEAQNYHGAFFKFPQTGLPAQYFGGRSYAEDNPPATLADIVATPGTSSVSGAAAFDGDGSFTITLAGERFEFTRAALESPFDPAITLTLPAADLTDSDDVCYNAVETVCATPQAFFQTGISDQNPDLQQVRFGRLTLEDVQSSGAAVTPQTVTAEYFDAPGGSAVWLTNDADSCTQFMLVDHLLSNDVEPLPKPGDQPVSLNPTPGSVTSIVSPASYGLTAGEAQLLFAPVAPPGAGYVDVRVCLGSADPTCNGAGAEQPWLRFDAGSGTFDDDPSGRVSFGQFSGRRDLIYIREPW